MKKLKLFPIMMLFVLLTSCSLAQPERLATRESEDQFVGFYVVFGERDIDRTGWVEYGEGMDFDTGFGNFTIPREVLFAEYDAEEHRWTFPNLNGYCAFATEVDETTTGSDGLQKLAIGFADFACNKLEGTIFIEKSDETYMVTYYDVYETADGRIYLDGTGNSMSSPATTGGAMSTKHENKMTVDGEETVTYEYEVSVALEPVVPTTSLTLVQYDANDVELSREGISLEQQDIVPNPDTAWMVVIEEDREGVCRRSAYEPPTDEDDLVAHTFYLPQEDGSIRPFALGFDVVK